MYSWLTMMNDWKENSKIGNDCTNPQEPRHNNYSFKQLEMQICVIEFMGLHLLFSLRCECKYVWIITALQPPRLRIATIPWSDPGTTTSTSLCTKENQLLMPLFCNRVCAVETDLIFINRRWNPVWGSKMHQRCAQNVLERYHSQWQQNTSRSLGWVLMFSMSWMFWMIQCSNVLNVRPQTCFSVSPGFQFYSPNGQMLSWGSIFKGGLSFGRKQYIQS